MPRRLPLAVAPAVAFVVLALQAPTVVRAADSKPIVGTERFAQPAAPAPLDGSRKRFIKTEPTGHAPRLSPKPEGVGPIIPPVALKGHRDSPPSTTAPIKAGRAPVNPPPPIE